VDDHEIVRAGLKQLLADYREFAVAGEASSGAEAIKMVRESNWDVVLLDVSMPDMNGIDTLKQIKLIKPDLPVLILSMHPEDHYGIHMLRAGASGYLHKECTSQDIVKAIRAVTSGRQYVSRALADRLAGDVGGDGSDELHSQLSKREFEVLCKLAAGQAVSEIAKELSLNMKTITTYRTRILQKMDLKSNADMTYYAMKHNLIE
jgi:DNA-binding NarL/FixJ family response regulator